MMRRQLPLLFAAAALVAVPGSASPQEKADAPKEAPAERKTVPTSLRVQLVISRYQGEKKVASLPYTLVVTAGDFRSPLPSLPRPSGGRMRMGVDTPIPVRPSGDDKQPAS